MRKCSKCDAEFDDEFKFCPNCGAEWLNPKKKITFFERRRLKEREKQEILNKAQLQRSDLKDVEMCNPTQLVFKHIGSLDYIFKKTILLFILSIILFLGCIGCAIAMKVVKLNPTARVLLLMLAFMLGFCSVAMFMNKCYQVKIFKNMKSSDFAMKKINYGKPPQLSINGQLFEINISQKCPLCLQTSAMHIEEFEGNFVAVCDNDRSHLLSIDTIQLKEMARAEFDKLKLANINSK